MNKKFCIIGANGQDGRYLSKLIIKSKNKVYGFGKQKHSKYFKNSKYFNYQKLNLNNLKILISKLKKIKPHFIINFAALHGSSQEEWNNDFEKSFKINTMPTKKILDYIASYNQKCFYFYASSMMCLKNTSVINEKTTRINENNYQITKNLSEILINNYRKKFDLKSSIVWFFQHESIIRKKSFFIPKIVNILFKSLKDNNYHEKVDNLDFFCDWGSAEEYMKIIYKIVENKLGEDFIIGTGKTLRGRDFVKNLFRNYNLDYKNHVGVNKNKLINKKFKAQNKKLRKILNVSPTEDIYSVSNKILKNLFNRKKSKTINKKINVNI